MSDGAGLFGAGVVAFVLFVAVVGVTIYFLDKASCQSRWQGSGMDTNYSLLGGCRVQLPNGQWIPADNYRDID